MRLSNILDYYFLMTLQKLSGDAVAGRHPSRREETFIYDLNYLVDTLEYQLGNTIANYLTLAVFGEMRHASDRCVVYIPHFPTGSRGKAVRVALDYDPLDILSNAVHLFNDFQWESAFGGQKWGHIAKFTHNYLTGKVSPQFFLDHIIDLVHNRGFAFDKSEALEMAGLTVDMSDERLADFLTQKTFCTNLLANATLHTSYYTELSYKVKKMVVRYYNIFSDLDPSYKWNYADRGWPEYTELTWGSQTLRKPELNYETASACKECGSVGLSRSMVSVGNGQLCEECYVQGKYWTCGWCGDIMNADDNDTRVDGNSWCDNCVKVAVECPQCGSHVGPFSVYAQEEDPNIKLCYKCDIKARMARMNKESEAEEEQEKIGWEESPSIKYLENDFEDIPF